MRHLGVDLQRVCIRKTLATVLACVPKIRLLMHRFNVLAKRAPTAQLFATVDTRLRARARRIMRAFMSTQRLSILEAFPAHQTMDCLHARFMHQSHVTLERLRA